jgi:hypothetical protein
MSSANSYVVTPNLVANGEINIARFVKVDTSADFKALQAGAGDAVIGISQEGPADAPGLKGSTTLVAEVGKTFLTYGPGAICLLTAGSGGWTRGSFLKPDADGKGVTASAGDAVGAYALESAGEGKRGLVLVWPAIASLVNSIVEKDADFTVAAADSGKIFKITGADKVASLPATAAGLRYTFLMTTAGLSTGTGLSISPVAADKIMGNGLSEVDNKDLILAGSGDRNGDLVEIVGDGADGWFITRVIGTWSKQA